MQIPTVTVPAASSLHTASLQQGHVKWILGLLCLQQVTYCCAGLSAALEKPLKQDNLSAPRHCSARTKRWDKGAVWLGIGSYWTYSDTHKSRCCLPVGRPALIPVKTTKMFNFAISFFPPLISILIFLAPSCLSLLFRAWFSCCSHWEQLLLSTKPLDALDMKYDSWVRAEEELSLSFSWQQGVSRLSQNNKAIRRWNTSYR